MTHRYLILEAEISGDPLARGYAGMTDQQVADDINTNARTAPDRDRITALDLFEATVQSDYEALGLGAKSEYDQILGLESINVAPGSKARTDLEAMFSATGSLAAIQALYSGQTFFRWQEIGLPAPVRVGHVEDVRR